MRPIAGIVSASPAAMLHPECLPAGSPRAHLKCGLNPCFFRAIPSSSAGDLLSLIGDSVPAHGIFAPSHAVRGQAPFGALPVRGSVPAVAPEIPEAAADFRLSDFSLAPKPPAASPAVPLFRMRDSRRFGPAVRGKSASDSGDRIPLRR